jgi:hypothetical protein
MLAANTQSNSQWRTSLVPSPQVNLPSSEPSVGDLCVSTNSRAGELCVYQENSRNRSFGCFIRDPKISTSRALGELLRGQGPSVLALGTWCGQQGEFPILRRPMWYLAGIICGDLCVTREAALCSGPRLLATTRMLQVFILETHLPCQQGPSLRYYDRAFLTPKME